MRSIFRIPLLGAIMIGLIFAAQISKAEESPVKNLGLLVTIEAKQGKEQAVADLLKNAVDLANQEEGTLTWYAFQIDDNHFGIFDTFNKESARQAHLHGKIADAIMKFGPDLFAKDVSIQPVRILASK